MTFDKICSLHYTGTDADVTLKVLRDYADQHDKVAVTLVVDHSIVGSDTECLGNHLIAAVVAFATENKMRLCE